MQGTNGQLHLDLHQGWLSAGASDATEGGTDAGNVLRATHVAALLATDRQIDPGELRVVEDRLHRVGDDGSTSHLLGWDFLLLKVESRSERDDFWLPELEEQFGRAVDALDQGMAALAESYRTAAVAIAWKSPSFTWTDRDRVITAVHKRFDAISKRGRGLVPGRAPENLSELVRQYGDSVDSIRAYGPMTEEQAFAGRR